MRYEITAKRIREAMQDKGMTQQELANMSGIGKSSISHYVNGTNEPGNKSAYMLAKALDVNPAWIMGLDVKKTNDNFSDEMLISGGAGTGNSQSLDKAHDFLQRYESANPEVQSAIRSLLKFPQ